MKLLLMELRLDIAFRFLALQDYSIVANMESLHLAAVRKKEYNHHLRCDRAILTSRS